MLLGCSSTYNLYIYKRSILLGYYAYGELWISDINLLKFYNGTHWGAICKDGFYYDAADVACRQLGYRRSSDVYG